MAPRLNFPVPELSVNGLAYPGMDSTVFDPLSQFHPVVADWFRQSFAAPTPAQADAWPAIRESRHLLVAAPTGSGKTLAEIGRAHV